MSARRKEDTDTTYWLGPEGRNGRDSPKQNDTSEKSVGRILKQILNSVSAIENKLEVVEGKLDRLSTGKVNRMCEQCSASLGRDSTDSSYAIDTGSHIHRLPFRKAKSSDIDEVVSSDSSSSDDDDDDSSEEQTDPFPVHDPKDFRQDIAVNHSLKVSREPIRKSLKTEQENVHDKHSGAQFYIESTTEVLPDNQAVEGKGIENVNNPSNIDNAKQTVDVQGKLNDANVKTNKPPLRNVDMPTDELESLGEVDDKEKDLSSSFKRAIAASGNNNRAEFVSASFTGQDVENELTDKPEEHTLTSSQRRRSNNQQMSMSGFKNEHGNTDNRFLKEAHESILQTSVRSGDLSNTPWIKSGAWKTDVVNLKRQLRELLEQQTRASRDSSCMRSAGIDTVICLDTSASMAGSPLGKAKTVISQLIDGFEQNAIEHDIEENVAVVVFGQQNKILNHLTNDYNVVRDELCKVTSCGPSPLWLGLALSLTEIKEKGNMVTVGESNILPRIILITDGYASPKYILSGDDAQSADTIEETKQDIVTLLETCRKFSRTIDCIQVGQSAQDMVQLLSGERVFGPDDVEYLTQFFRVQDMADELTKKITSGEIQTDGVDEIIKNSSLTKKAQDDLKELIKDVKFVRSEEEQPTEELNVETTVSPSGDNSDQSARQGQASGGESDMIPTPTRKDEVFVQQDVELSETNEEHEAGIIDDVKEPVFGASVAPSETWNGIDARRDLTGTVMGPRKKGMVKILWSDGTTDRCRYGVNGVYDFKIVPDICFGLDVMHVGAIVERGPDWKWKDQDGGLGSIGVVTKQGDRVVFVTWSHGGQGNYRFGYNKKYDVKLCNSRPRQQETHWVWQIQDKSGNWHDFEQAATQSIEQMYNYNPDSQFVVQLKSLSLRISIGKLEATDSKTKQTYMIRRLEQSNEHSSARDSL